MLCQLPVMRRKGGGGGSRTPSVGSQPRPERQRFTAPMSCVALGGAAALIKRQPRIVVWFHVPRSVFQASEPTLDVAKVGDRPFRNPGRLDKPRSFCRSVLLKVSDHFCPSWRLGPLAGSSGGTRNRFADRHRSIWIRTIRAIESELRTLCAFARTSRCSRISASFCSCRAISCSSRAIPSWLLTDIMERIPRNHGVCNFQEKLGNRSARRGELHERDEGDLVGVASGAAEIRASTAGRVMDAASTPVPDREAGHSTSRRSDASQRPGTSRA